MKIAPEFIPTDIVPLSDKDEVPSHPYPQRVTMHGKTLVGRVETTDPFTFTVGNSDPIYYADLKSAFEV